MVYSRSPTTRRPRSRLRKRNTFRGFRKYYNFSTGNDEAIYDRNKVLSSGFTVGETWGCLDKAWVGFRTAKRLENYSDMKLYASIIQKLEKELKIEVNDFPELGLCACDLEEDATEEEEEEDKDNYVEISFDSL
jgi:hypothetical protein